MFDRSPGRGVWAAVLAAAIAVDVFADSPVAAEAPTAEIQTSTASLSEMSSRSDEIVALFNSSRSDEAQKRWIAWSKADKKSAWAWLTGARLAFLKKQYKKTVAYCNDALERQPGLAEAYYWKGRGLEAQNKTLEAANEYRAATLAKQPYSQADEALARLSAQLGSDSSISSDPLRSQ